MILHFKPVNQLTAFRAKVLLNLFFNPLGNSDFLHPQGIWNYIGMVADAVDDRLCAELLDFIAWEFLTFIAARDVVTYGTFQKAVIGAVFAAVANEI